MTRHPIARHPLALSAVLALASACYSGADASEDGDTPASAGPGATAADDDGTPTTSAGDDSTGDDTGATPTEFDPAPVRLRLLLARHYHNTIRDLLGEPAAAVADPPTDTAINGFEAIAAAQVALTDSAVDRYEKSARAVAAEAMKDTVRIAGLLGCQPTGPDDAACHRSFVTTFGRLIWRRPLTSEEIDRYTAVAQDGALQFNDFNAGVEAAIFTFLQSPYFLYQVEVGEPDPNDPEERGLTSLELATRLSFFLLDTTPTAELLTIAENGGLATADQVRAVAEVMDGAGPVSEVAAELAELARNESDKTLQVTEFISVSDLASLMNVKPADVIKTCMGLGIFVSINQRLDAEIIELVASEFDYEVNFISAEEQVEVEEEEQGEESIMQEEVEVDDKISSDMI